MPQSSGAGCASELPGPGCEVNDWCTPSAPRDNPREGSMGGRHAATTQLTAHRDFKERSVVLAVAHPKTLGRLPLSISLRSPSPILAATFMPPRGRPTLVVLPPVASSSVASLSSASSCDAAAACRSLALPAFPPFVAALALLAAYFGPSSLSSSPRARTTLLTPTAIICRQVISKERKKENRQPKGGMGGRHAATTQGF